VAFVDVHEPDLLFTCFQAVSRLQRNAVDPETLLGAIDQETHVKVVAILSDLLRERQQPGQVECASVNARDSSSLGVRVLTHTNTSGEKTTYFFRFKDAASAAALPIVGVFLTLLSSHPLGAAVSVAQIARGLWSQVVGLHHEHDYIGLEVLKTIAGIRASNFAGFQPARVVGEEFPSTEEICSVNTNISFDEVRDRLKRLDSLRLIECKYWSGKTGDFSNKENRWGERL
jgi:hypothetical protein